MTGQICVGTGGGGRRQSGHLRSGRLRRRREGGGKRGESGASEGPAGDASTARRPSLGSPCSHRWPAARAAGRRPGASSVLHGQPRRAAGPHPRMPARMGRARHPSREGARRTCVGPLAAPLPSSAPRAPSDGPPPSDLSHRPPACRLQALQIASPSLCPQASPVLPNPPSLTRRPRPPLLPVQKRPDISLAPFSFLSRPPPPQLVCPPPPPLPAHCLCSRDSLLFLKERRCLPLPRP